MDPLSTTRPNPRWMTITGIVLSLLPIPLLAMSAYFKIIQAPMVLEGFGKLGIADLALFIGVVEVVCTMLYLIPQTAVLGAILLAGYLGGAILSHFQAGPELKTRLEALPAFIMGIVLWLGQWFRDPRVRALAPIRFRR